MRLKRSKKMLALVFIQTLVIGMFTILASLVVLPVRAGGDSVTVDGRWVFQHPVKGNVPVKEALVEIRDDRWMRTDTTLRSVKTDDNGYFVASGDWKGKDLYVKLWAVNDAATVVSNPLWYLGEQIYHVESQRYNDIPDGTHWPLGTLGVAAPNSPGAYNILNTVLTGRRFLQAQAGVNAPKVTVFFKDDYTLERSWYYGGSLPDPFSAGGVHIQDSPPHNDQWDEATILHEYGHFIMDVYADHWPPLSDLSHGYYTRSDYAPHRTAWIEGWPHFFSAAVRQWAGMDWDTPNPIESNDYTYGDGVEGAVAGILWDIYDSQNEQGDTLGLGFTPIWDVLRHYDPDPNTNDWTIKIWSNPTIVENPWLSWLVPESWEVSGYVGRWPIDGDHPWTIYDFWDGWWASQWWQNYGYSLWSIFKLHGASVPDDTTPPSNPESFISSHDPEVWSGVNTIDISWVRGTDDLSGVEGYYVIMDTSSDTVPEPGAPGVAHVGFPSSSYTSPPLDTGRWWFHLRTRDYAGNNATDTVHIGPFYITLPGVVPGVITGAYPSVYSRDAGAFPVGTTLIVAFQTNEWEIDQDLNEDGDTSDTVIRYVDSFYGPTVRISDQEIMNTSAVGERPSVYGDIIAFQTRETSVGEDLNGDGTIDGDTIVIRYYDLSTNTVTNTSQVGINPSVSGNIIAFQTSGIDIAKPSGLVSWWPGDGDALDIIDANHGTLKNGATFAPGKVGQAFSFDGVDDYVEIPYDPSFNLSSFTLQTWVKFTQNDRVADIIARPSGGNPTDGYSFFRLSNSFGRIAGGVQGEGQAYSVSVSTDLYTFADDNWHMATFVRDIDANKISIYVDGVLYATYLDSSPGDMEHNLKGIFIGSTDGNTGFFKGLIDEVEIYNRALSASEIQAIYDAVNIGEPKIWYYDIATQTPYDTGEVGLSPSVSGDVIAFETPWGMVRYHNISEPWTYDVAEGTHPAVSGGIIAFSASGQIKHYDISTGTTVDTGVTGDFPSVSGVIIAFQTGEADAGEDLNKDGILDDIDIIRLFCLKYSLTMNTIMEGEHPSVYHAWRDPRDEMWIEDPSDPGKSCWVAADPGYLNFQLAFHVHESQVLRDLNQDGDQDDHVIHWFSTGFGWAEDPALRTDPCQPSPVERVEERIRMGLIGEILGERGFIEVEITLPEVTVPGITSARPITDPLPLPGPGPDPIPGHTIIGFPIEVTTTATYSGPIDIGISYDPTEVTNEGNLRLMQQDPITGQFNDITTEIDTLNEMAYGQAPHLSIFAVVEITDNEPPTTTLAIGTPQYTDQAGNLYVASTTPFTVEATDLGLGVGNTYYRINSGPWILYTGAFTITDSDGTYAIDYYSDDLAGNQETFQSATVILDATPPDTILELPVGTYYTDAEANTYVTSATEFSLMVSDASSGVSSIFYRINGGDTIEYQNTFRLSGPDGAYTIDYHSVDNVDNVEVIKSKTFILTSLKVDSYLTDSEFNPITNFDVIFAKDKTNGYKLVATNPGQFYYHINVTNNWPITIDTLTIDASPPTDFVLKGAVPIHIYLDDVDITNLSTIQGTTITITNIPAGSKIHITVHIDYALKGTTYTSPDDFQMKAYQFAAAASGSSSNPGGGLTGTYTSSTTLTARQKKVTAIAGFVTDANGNPIENAIVKLFDAGGNLIATTVTDTNGFYYFLNMPAGDYTIEVPYNGQTYTQTTTVAKGELAQVDFKIE